MENQLIFNFTVDISKINIPTELNNPFGSNIPEIGRIAAKEFQEFITSESRTWQYDFSTRNGKMFGILVVRKKDGSYGYIGTVSGKIDKDTSSNKIIPSVFDNSVDDFFLDKGMRKLTEIGDEIKKTNNQSSINTLKEKRKKKSIAIQQQLFENYQFLNLLGKTKNVLQIFEDTANGYPPSAAGECAAPKLLHFAFKHQLMPIALAEFWWGNSLVSKKREHQFFYPACENRCRPILEYMLDNTELFDQANTSEKPN